MVATWLADRVVSARRASRRRLGGSNSQRNGKRIAGHAAYGSVVGLPVFTGALIHGHRPPNVPGWAGHLGNVCLTRKRGEPAGTASSCLLYTSDAADE